MTLRIFGQAAKDSNTSELDERFEQHQERTGVPADEEKGLFEPTGLTGEEQVLLSRDRAVSTSEANKLFTSRFLENPELASDIQLRLFRSGKYGLSKKELLAELGTPGPATQSAFEKFLKEAARLTDAVDEGKPTLGDLLDDFALLGDERGVTGGGGGGGGGGSVVTDPAALRQLLEQVAGNLGLDTDMLNDDVQLAFVAAFHALQGGGGRTSAGQLFSPDPTAQAREFLRDRFGDAVDRAERQAEATEAQGSVEQVLGVFDQTIGGGA